MADRLRLSDVLARVLPTGPELKARIQMEMLAKWTELSRGMGVSSASEAKYVGGLSAVDGPTARVELGGVFPNMLEQGMGPAGVGSDGAYDLRTFMLRPTTRNIRHGEKGMFLNVPFEHSESSILGMGGRLALKAANALKPTISTPIGGGKFKTLWAKNDADGFGRLPAGFAPKLKDHHATDPLASMVRLQADYSKATQSTFKTWRVLTEWGKPWIHPGIRARKLGAEVAAAGADIVLAALRSMGA